MGKLKRKYQSARKALTAFKEVLDEPYSQIIQDAAIQRFEFTFEICWKTLQAYLKESEGLTANSPKAVFREVLSIDLITSDQAELALEMTDDRNLTSHTYHEGLAKNIYEKLPQYYELCKYLLEQIKARS